MTMTTTTMTMAFQGVSNTNRLPRIAHFHQQQSPFGRIPTGTCSSLMMAGNDNSNRSDSQNKKANKAQKPSRFSQTVHTPSTGSGKKKSKSSSPNSNMKSYNNQRDMDLDNGVSNNNNNNMDNDRMWKTKKSIDDLEARLTKRWGTELSPWTARDGNDEDDDEDEERDPDDNDDDDYDVPVFRARAVVDPWQRKAEKEAAATAKEAAAARSENDDDEDEDENDDNDDNNKNSKKSGAFGNIDSNSANNNSMLNKVRRNQERLQQKKREFYDRDDEGYEVDVSKTNTNSNANTIKNTKANTNTGKVKRGEINFDHMIAPEPAGGRGTNDVNAYDDDDLDDDDEEEDDDEEDEEDYYNDNNDDKYAPHTQDNKYNPTVTKDKPASGGFFFRDPGSAGPVSEPKTPEVTEEMKLAQRQQDKEQRRKAQSSVPLLDENDRPLLLTIKQAERDFQKSLRASAAALNDDENDDDDQAVYTRPETRSWVELGIDAPLLLQNLDRMNCERPLAVQDKTCPAVVSGDDVLVGTYTGSGKTLAFLVPLIQRLLAASIENLDDESNSSRDRGLQILIIAPGRELASQIASVARELLQDTNLGVMLAIGGTTFTRNLEQIRKRKPTIIVGTPGRIAELVVGRPGDKTGRLKTTGLKALVLDEFDALLEYKPHSEPTSAIMDTLKRRHGNFMQTVMCSATASDVLGSAKLSGYLRPGFQQAMADSDDLLVTSGGEATTRVSKTVIHGVLHVPQQRLALDTLRKLLYTDPVPQQILIFVENSRKVRIVVEKLEIMGIIAAPLHGGFGSEKMDRAEVSKALREGYVGIVVATELAARGLDAPLLTHVVNFDLPTDASHYAHRAGRCGRGGRPGVVINFTTGPQERTVPKKFAAKLGVKMYTVEARNSRLSIIDPDSQQLDQYDKPPR